jgi:hypothetical protein
MRKIQIFGTALFAVLALSALVASSAFAEDQWLINNIAVTKAEPAVTAGKLLLRLLSVAGNVHLLCDGKFVGTVRPKGEDQITSVTDLSGNTTINCEVLHAELGVCTGSLLALVKAINLPWHTQLLLLTNGDFTDMFEAEPGGKLPAYESACTGSKGETIKETCEGKLETDDLVNEPAGAGVFGAFLNQLSSKCAFPGNVAHVEGTGITTSTAGSVTVGHN